MKRIRELRKERNLTMKRLGEVIGVAESTISLYENGKRQPDNDTLQKLADYFNVTVDYLLGRKEKADEIYIESEDITYFEVIGSVRAGYGGMAVENHTGEKVPIPTAFLNGLSEEDYFVLRISGNSMYPKLLDGDLVLVRRCSSVDSGTTAVVLYDGQEATVKKVKYIPGEDWVELIPCNPEYTTKRIEGPDLQECRVLGKVVKLIRDV